MASQENGEDPKNKSTAVEKNSILRSFKNPPTVAIDDLEEEKMLRSRIEEQSILILLLKHRADETLLRYLAMQNINSELNDRVTHLHNELTSKTKHMEALEIKCKDLATDKNGMEFKKRHSVQLTIENQQLRKELATCELKLQEQAAQHKSREESLLGQLCDAQQRHMDAVKMCEDFKQKLEEVGKQHDVKESNIKESTTHVKKEKSKFVKMQLSKAMQEKDREILQLEFKWKEEKKARIETQKRFELEAEAVNTDLRVKSLQSDLEESKAKLKTLSMDFKAFTEHSTNLLEQERNLNKRLRDLIGQI